MGGLFCRWLAFRRGDNTQSQIWRADIPGLSNWGEPVLLGPGSIHVAHTPREFISKKELQEAVDLYNRLATTPVPVPGDDDMAQVPQDEWNAVRDKVLGPPGGWASRYSSDHGCQASSSS